MRSKTSGVPPRASDATTRPSARSSAASRSMGSNKSPAVARNNRRTPPSRRLTSGAKAARRSPRRAVTRCGVASAPSVANQARTQANCNCGPRTVSPSSRQAPSNASTSSSDRAHPRAAAGAKLREAARLSSRGPYRKVSPLLRRFAGNRASPESARDWPSDLIRPEPLFHDLNFRRSKSSTAIASLADSLFQSLGARMPGRGVTASVRSKKPPRVGSRWGARA